ncbi:MAG TPA: hypothetical protein VM513_09110 [Kofleriaceae bacterium]|nr:hypothetical protein [Kofleriaceae bacterium]
MKLGIEEIEPGSLWQHLAQPGALADAARAEQEERALGALEEALYHRHDDGKLHDKLPSS